jgi:hypothetical protein
VQERAGLADELGIDRLVLALRADQDFPPVCREREGRVEIFALACGAFGEA